MGAYLGSPVKEKVQEQGGNNKITYMATSMQGWRVHQEDSHNCILDFGNKCSLFAVYDGHGGSEVAVYISENFPKFLLENGLFESDDLTATLQKLFVEFDSTLCNEKVIQAMDLVKEKENPPKTHANEEDEREALFEEAVALSKEASVSLGSIIQQYAEISRQMQDGDGRSEKRALGEPSAIVRYVKRRRIHRENATVVDDEEALNSVTVGSETVTSTTETVAVNGSCKVDSTNSNENKKSAETINGSEVNAEAEMKKPAKESDDDSGAGDISSVSDVNKTTSKKNGEKSKSSEQQSDEPHSTKSDADAADASTDDEDDDEDYDVEEDEEVDDEEQVVDESAEDQEEVEDEEDEILMGKNKPGYDSGATACVALLFEDRVVVANVGDSRAVLCRDGKAVDLSTDHKPEDTIEKNRIENAGGAVSDDGRVNGGLNLSRALGDHFYKQKADLPLEKQMITACPDVLTSEITDKDTLLVIACDGIWNSLTSQEVVDFINKRIGTRSLKEIGAEMCNHCCAADTSGDGTGCDNMTIIIVDLKAGGKTSTESSKTNDNGEKSAARDC